MPLLSKIYLLGDIEAKINAYTTVHESWLHIPSKSWILSVHHASVKFTPDQLHLAMHCLQSHAISDSRRQLISFAIHLPGLFEPFEPMFALCIDSCVSAVEYLALNCPDQVPLQQCRETCARMLHLVLSCFHDACAEGLFLQGTEIWSRLAFLLFETPILSSEKYERSKFWYATNIFSGYMPAMPDLQNGGTLPAMPTTGDCEAGALLGFNPTGQTQQTPLTMPGWIEGQQVAPDYAESAAISNLQTFTGMPI